MVNLEKKAVEKGKMYFIHIPKTGGQYVHTKKWLIDDIPFNDKELKIKGHWACYGQKNKYGDFTKIPSSKLDNALVLSVVRNPFDLLVSYYHDPDKDGVMQGWRWCNRDHRFKTFEDFIKAYCDPSFEWNVKPLHRFLFFQIFDKDGKCRCDTILRSEQLDDDLEVLGHLFGVKTRRSKRENVSGPRQGKPYQYFYTDDMISMVNEKCHRELSMFGYGFDCNGQMIDPSNLFYNYDRDEATWA